LRKTFLSGLPFWCIPMIYSGVTILLGLVFPHLEYRLAGYNHGVTVPVAIAVFSSVAQGVLALTAIVFSLAFVMVQFSSTAYSPRLILWLSRDPIIWHAMGVFTATFLYSLVTLIWVDRWGDGRVPFFSGVLVFLLLTASIMVMGFLVQRLALLQVAGVMRFIGEKGRQLIAEMYSPLTRAEIAKTEIETQHKLAIPNLPLTQKVLHTGEPMAIAAYSVEALVNLAKQAEGLIVMPFAVGDVVVEGEALLTVHGGRLILSQAGLRAAVRLEPQRTFEQDPKYSLRLLVDIAIKALSPAVNDPTTAVQALNQIEDLLRRLGARDLEVGQVRDETGVLRLTFPTPTWEDFLMLAFDEIRFYGTSSLQVMRRLRTALYDLADALPPERQKAVRHYLEHLDSAVRNSMMDTEDQATALQQDRQGLGLSRGS
jgi:uncharacterized membrane protein